MSPSLPMNLELRQFLIKYSRSLNNFSSNFVVECFVTDEDDVDNKVVLLIEWFIPSRTIDEHDCALYKFDEDRRAVPEFLNSPDSGWQIFLWT